MKRDRDVQQTLSTIVRRLDEALQLLDAMDMGDGDCAASIERAVQRAKRELRTGVGFQARCLPRLPVRLKQQRRMPQFAKTFPRRRRDDRKI
jgi:hypothetical protein